MKFSVKFRQLLQYIQSTIVWIYLILILVRMRRASRNFEHIRSSRYEWIQLLVLFKLNKYFINDDIQFRCVECITNAIRKGIYKKPFEARTFSTFNLLTSTFSMGLLLLL